MVPEVEEMKNEHHRDLIPADKAIGLHDAIESCNRQTTRLNAILDDVLSAPNDSKIQRGRKALRSLRREKEVAGIQASIESSKSTFTLYYVRHPVSLPIRPKVSWLERCCDIPATSVLHFVGRDDVLRRLDEIFGVGSTSPSDTTLDQPRRAVLLGMGGQGKTQTALRYCRNVFQNRTFNTVLWIDASSEINANHAIESVLSKAGISTSAVGYWSNALALKNALASLNGPCLLVFDNYDTPKNFPKIADMFVKHEQLCILLTSRHHESLRLGMPIHVREMDQSDAEDLLLISSGLIRQYVNPQDLEHTVNMLGRLPLALDQAGAYINKLHLSLDVFEKHYLDRQKKILQYTPDLFEYRKSLLPGSEPSVLSVFTTWELSLEQLGDNRPHFEHLLTLSAFFDHNRVHEALFSTRCTLNFTACSGVQDGWLQCMLTDSAWDSYRFQDIIANLHGLSLLQKFWIEDGHIVFSLHPLVNDWLRTRIGEKDRASMVVEAAVTAAGSDDCPKLSSHLNRCSRDFSHFEEIFWGDCIDMRSRRTIAEVAQVPIHLAEEYARAKSLCCPHGRPCQTIPSLIRLKRIVYCCMAHEVFSLLQLLSCIIPIVVAPFGIMGTKIPRSVGLDKVLGPTCRSIRKMFDLYKDVVSEDGTLSLHLDTLDQELVALFERIDAWSGADIDFKEIDILEKQAEKIINGSLHNSFNPPSTVLSYKRATISAELTTLIDTLKVFSAFRRGRGMALIRNELRSLPFLQSGF